MGGIIPNRKQYSRAENILSGDPKKDTKTKPSPIYEHRRIEPKNEFPIQTRFLQKMRVSNYQITGNDMVIIERSLESHHLLYRQTSQQRLQLIHYMKCYSIKEKTYLVKKGDLTSLFFIVREGQIEMQVDSETLKVMKQGDLIGDQSIIYETESSATYYARTACKLFGVSKNVMEKALKQILKRNYNQTRQYIRNLKLFNSFSPGQRDAIVSKMYILRYQDGQTIFLKNQTANVFFVLIKGEVGLVLPEKNQIVIRAGDSFGQSALNARGKRFGNAICLQNALLLAISRQAISDCLNGNFDSIIHNSIIKWALRRCPIFKQLSNMLIEKIITHGAIKKYQQGELICSQGVKYPPLIVCLEGKINGFGIGTIFNQDFDNIESTVLQTSIVKQERGAIFSIAFHRLNYIVGNVLNSRRNVYQNQLGLLAFKDKSFKKVELKNLCLIQKISEGEYDSKYIVHDPIITKRLYTIKIINKNTVIQYQLQNFISEQRKLYQTLNSSFITNFHQTYKDNHFVYFLYTFQPNGTFRNILQQLQKVSKSYARFYLGCLILCLQELHTKGIVHRDIQPDSLLIDIHGYLVAGNLGFAKRMKNGVERTYTRLGVPKYMAPEVIEGTGYTFSVDLWAVGVIMYEMVCGVCPFGKNDDNSLKIYQEILKKVEIPFPQSYQDQNGKEIIQKLLSIDPVKRSEGSFTYLKKMKYFAGFNWEELSQHLMKTPFFPKVQNYTEIRHFKSAPICQELMKDRLQLGIPLRSQRFPEWDAQF